MPAFAVVLLVLLAALVTSWYLYPKPWAGLLLGLWRKRLGLSSCTVSVDGIRWHFLRGGKGPVLVLLHGFGADAGCWLPLASKIGQQFSLVIPDLPGFGQSEPPQKLRFNIEAQARRLMAFLDELDISECLVAGNSMGGYLATQLADLDPDRVRALWLLAPLGVRAVPPGAALEAIDSGKAQAGKINSVAHYRREFLPTIFNSEVRFPYPILAMQARSAMARQAVVPEMLRQARFESEPLESIARRVEHPTLVQWGDRDQIVSPAGLPVLEKAFRNVTASLIRDCGHLPMFEKPDESTRLFMEFLEHNHLAKPGH